MELMMEDRIAEKQMPAHRMGRFWKFRKEEVDEWVRSGCDGKTSTPETSSTTEDA